MNEQITVYVLINSSKQWPMNCSVNQSQKLGQIGGLHKLRWQASGRGKLNVNKIISLCTT